MERGKGRGQEVDARGLKEEDFEGDVRKVNAIQSTTPLVVLPSASRNAVQGVPCFPSMKRR